MTGRQIGGFAISLGDSNAFAALSGDRNPIHVNPVWARRSLFQGSVVHGIHVLLRSVEQWLSQGGPRAFSITEISATFLSPARTGAELVVTAEDSEGAATLSVFSGEETVQKIKLRHAPAGAITGKADSPMFPGGEPANLDFQAAAQASGRETLNFHRSLAAQLFPHLTAEISGLALAALLTSTRIVGMRCPGLHSLYSAVAFTFADETASPEDLDYKVVQAVPRLAMLKLAMEAPGIKGSLTAFHRPALVRQLSFQDAKEIVAPGRFAQSRAVVVGGSRGLGEIAAKLLAAGGAEVVISYKAGREDALELAAEIASGGGRCQSFPFDVLAPTASAYPLEARDAAPNQIYYFATPFITGNTKRPWDRALFERYCAYYAEGLVTSATVLAEFFGLSLPTLALCQPSTGFLDHPVAGFGEYMAGKAAGEAAGNAFAARHPGLRHFCPRLPRVLTDQTNSLIPVSAENPIPLLLPILDAMQPPQGKS